MSDAWYWLDMYGRDYAAALKVMGAAPASWFASGYYPLGLYQGPAYQGQRDAVRAKAAFAQARGQLEGRIKASPDDAYLHANLALALAGLGERDAALGEARRAVDLQPVGKYPRAGIYQIVNLATVQASIGNTGAAIKLLTQLLSMPAGGDVSIPILRLDPTWDPIRNDPRFQALLQQYENAQPVAAASEAEP
jgi:serine/threonine-protein kinase